MTPRFRKLLLLAGSILAGGLVATTPAASQTLDEIVVTARKREESLQTVPLAVSVQTGEALQQHHITDLYSLQSVTPSLQVKANAGTTGVPAFTIRGIGTSVYGSTIESSVGLVVDDVPIGRTEMANIQLFDIGRIEVLRGPQGMLFGKNAAAGLINIVTQDPKLDTTEFLAHVQYGNLNAPTSGNSAMVNLAGNLPLGRTAALRLDGFFTHNDGFEKNVIAPDKFSGYNTGGIRGKLLWEPTDWARIRLQADYSNLNGPGEALSAYAAVPPTGVTRTLISASGITPSHDNALFAADGSNRNLTQIGGVALKGEFDVLNGHTLTNVLSWRKVTNSSATDSDWTQADILSVGGGGKDYSQLTEELRLASPAGQRFTYQGGVFFQHLNVKWNFHVAGNLFLSAPPPGFNYLAGGEYVTSEPQNSAAAFFEGQYKILDRLRLTAGARYTHDALDFSIHGIPYPGALIPLAGNYTANNSVEHNNISYRFSLDYDIAPDVMGYLSYAKGYKGPGFDNNAAAVVGPEIPTDYEIGLKATVFDKRLRLNLALFDETFDGFQTQVLVNVNGIGQGVTVNAGKLKSRGVEAEFTAIPVESLTINGGVVYNDTRLETLPNQAFPCYPDEPVGTGPIGSVVNRCYGGVQNIDGNRLAFAPLWTGNLSARYQRSVGEGWDGFVQADGYFKSSYNLTYFVDPQTRVGGYAIVGLNAGVQSQDGRYNVTFFVRNLTDQRIPSFIYVPATASVFGDAAYVQQLSADSFRTIGVSFDCRM